MSQSVLITGIAAHIYAHPALFAPPVIQTRRAGRHPKSIISLWAERTKRRATRQDLAQRGERIANLTHTLQVIDQASQNTRRELAGLMSGGGV